MKQDDLECGLADKSASLAHLVYWTWEVHFLGLLLQKYILGQWKNRLALLRRTDDF